jgi:hypothetical protein
LFEELLHDGVLSHAEMKFMSGNAMHTICMGFFLTYCLACLKVNGGNTSRASASSSSVAQPVEPV